MQFKRIYAFSIAMLIGVSAISIFDFAHSQPSGDAVRPSWKTNDTWTYTNFQVATKKTNRTWKTTITNLSNDKVKSRRDDSVAPSSETEVTFDEFYPNPLFAGRTWQTSRTINGVRIESTNTARAWENVSTPAGTFRAMRVESTFTRPEGSFRQVIWYAPAARNFVKLQFLDNQGNAYQATELTSLKLE